MSTSFTVEEDSEKSNPLCISFTKEKDSEKKDVEHTRKAERK